MNQIEPIASKIPYMVAVGNHEFKEYAQQYLHCLMIHNTMSIIFQQFYSLPREIQYAWEQREFILQVPKLGMKLCRVYD